MAGRDVRSDEERDNCCHETEQFHVVVVGAGMAGLTCVRELLATCPGIHVTMIEAADAVGGRVRKVASKLDDNDYVDAGAEFIHGRDHILWDTIRDFQRRGLLPTDSNQKEDETKFEFEGLEPHFILAHADGGPQESPTPQGKFGMYYVDDELLMYNDPKVQPLADVMEAIMNPTKAEKYDDSTSLADALAQTDIPHLSPSLMQLCVAGYGNTAGCCDLSQLSMTTLMAFENYWECHEEVGDYRPTFGMYRVVEAMMRDIHHYNTEATRFNLRLNTPVDRIVPDDTRETLSDKACSQKIKVLLCPDKIGIQSPFVLADAVVVTVPPTRLPQLFDSGHDLTPQKQEALARLGFADRIVKVCCKFQDSNFWPLNLQSIIAAGQPIPEVWFRETDEGSCWIVGYLVSSTANEFVECIQELQSREYTDEILHRERFAKDIMLQQLSAMLKVRLEDLQKNCIADQTILLDWKEDFPFIQGGYMFPKTGMILGGDLQALAEPMMDGRVFFAGEATNINACCTIQAAMETGIRSAKEISSIAYVERISARST